MSKTVQEWSLEDFFDPKNSGGHEIPVLFRYLKLDSDRLNFPLLRGLGSVIFGSF